MSLSFVKSAVLSSSDGVSHNEEKAIESTETQSLRSLAASGANRPLFDQLRANREADQEKRDEAAKALRGTRALDEEDCAHLDAVERVRIEREELMKSQVEDEVALFRAARADRRAAGAGPLDEVLAANHDGLEVDEAVATTEVRTNASASATTLASIAPKIIAKKRRRRSADKKGKNGIDTGTEPDAKRTKDGVEAGKKESIEICVSNASTDISASPRGGIKISSLNVKKGESSEEENGGLGGLLGGYGTDSD